MNVICGSIYDDQLRFVVMNDAVNICEKFAFKFRRDQIGSVFRGENDMDENFDKRLGHSIVRPFQGRVLFWVSLGGFHPS